ncbi:MAG: ribonuclease III [Omnitrophica WOR_2 bacterium RIFCSPLOWO2_12_FULL_51_24]|nr:MAG: ribonuclease III [Omnitrophica WOR_2 bacterium RIFCSPHIGHO2_01_FULL_49_10]OGX32521.1 MAG: ribonuclease III [Omnitrophica WOR_2 bacterium RIFCSPLOWO2_02_FULL_50_19]OGX43282.1 MAG: ribonuclease III [Omnitrophica WOR_2 bacterium RIFCSPLOWO2_12_FULL_51_24]
MVNKSRLPELKKFERRIKYPFKNRQLLAQALIHRSYAYEHTEGKVLRQQGKVYDNERLEFLGDAVLGVAISDCIFRRFPDFLEGEMTRIRSALVSRSTLEGLARRLDLGEMILFGKGEAASGGAGQSRNLVGAYEAVIGAIFVDGGFKKSDKFIESQFKAELERISEGGAKKDYKSILQEYTSKAYKSTPKYMVVSEEGPDHQKHFKVAVSFGGIVRGRGEGKNKKSAEQDAAYKALLNEGLLDKST